MRIRNLALGYLVGLSFLAFAGAMAVWMQCWTRLSDLRETEYVLQALQPAVRFVERLALERGVYNQVLLSSEGGPDRAKALLEKQVAATDALFSETLGKIDLLQPSLAARLRRPVERARKIVLEARAAADPVWQAASQEAPGAALALVPRFAEAGAEVEEMVATAMRVVSSHDAGMGLMLGVSTLSNDMREFAGQRSAIISRYVATGRGFLPTESVRLTELGGALHATWQRLQRVASQVDSPAIYAAIAAIRSEFFDGAEPTYAAIADSGREGGPAPMDFSTWRAWTVTQLSLTLGARDVPLVQALAQAVDARTEAKSTFQLAISALGGVFAFVLITGWWMLAGLIRPLARLTVALDELGSDDRVRPGSGTDVVHYSSLYGARSDEIGSLARGLSRLHRHAVDLERLYLRFNAVLANLPQGVCFYDAEGLLIVSNRRYAELYGIDAWAIRPGMSLADVRRLRQVAGALPDVDGDDHVRVALENARANQIVACKVNLPAGRTYAVEGTRVPGGGWLATHLDVTDRTRAEQQIAHMSNYDGLTGLANRSLFLKELERGLKRIQRSGKFAVMCLDLDHFKWVNDTLGHDHGDELLKQVSKRISLCVREADLVARLDGDEFAVVFDDIPGEEIVTRFAERMIQIVSEPYDLSGHQAVVGTSIGIAISPNDGRDVSALMKAADMALHRAKADGRGTFRFFEPDMDGKMQRRRELELDLRKALPNGELDLHYQPVVDLSTGEIAGFEALLRWTHPVRGRVSPADFIPLAEETGLIVEIGAWVIRQACREAMTWSRPVKVAVNLSPRQFANLRLLADVTQALNESHLPPSRLELEITERVMLDNTETVLRILNNLRGLGVRFAMDDFGTGYSSLSYLRRFPFDRIKIDQSFVRDLANGPESVAIVRAALGLAAGLGMATTAEGVETAQQLEILRAEGCTEVQGYLMSRPVPREDVPGLLTRGSLLRAA